MGIMHTATYVVGASSILGILNFAGGSTANLINGAIGCAISIVAAFVATWILGFKETNE